MKKKGAWKTYRKCTLFVRNVPFLFRQLENAGFRGFYWMEMNVATTVFQVVFNVGNTKWSP